MVTINHKEKPRFKTLDALRGIAALSVVFTHMLNGFPIREKIHTSPFNILLTAGHESVLFFFLLSGFVLVYQYGDDKNYSYTKFILQRIFRIYLPFVAAIILCVILMHLCQPQKTWLWISYNWTIPVTPGIFFKHLMMIGDYNTYVFNNVIWSLIHEMRISILFPFLLWVLNRKTWQLITITLLLWVTGCIFIEKNWMLGEGYCNGYSYSIYYLNIFLAGGYIAKKRAYLSNQYQKLSKYNKAILLLLAIVIYNYALSFADGVFSNFPGSAVRQSRLAMMLSDAGVTVASFYIIITAIHVGTKNWLNTRVPQFFGKISYSIYLIHLPVLAFIYFTFNKQIPTIPLLILSLLPVMLVAFIFNKYIERQSAALAKRLLRRPDVSGH